MALTVTIAVYESPGQHYSHTRKHTLPQIRLRSEGRSVDRLKASNSTKFRKLI